MWNVYYLSKLDALNLMPKFKHSQHIRVALIMILLLGNAEMSCSDDVSKMLWNREICIACNLIQHRRFSCGILCLWEILSGSMMYNENELLSLQVVIGMTFLNMIILSLWTSKCGMHLISVLFSNKNTVQFMGRSYLSVGAWGSAAGWGTILQAGRQRVWIPMRSLDFFKWSNPSSHIMAFGSTQPLTEMSTRYIPEGLWAADA
jgi:hypothetical protein